MRKIALRLAYDGTHFAGSQWQSSGRTVQGELEQAWQRLTHEPCRITFSGRTDAGVHAQGQVAHVATASQHPPATIQRALNALLPEDLVVLEVWPVAADFHARFSARWRYYRYLIDPAAVPLPPLRHFALHHPGRLDLTAMQAALHLLEGEHDFAAFGSLQGYTGNTIRYCWQARCTSLELYGRRVLAIDLVANAFLRHMVRTIVGTVLLVGRQQMSVATFAAVLQQADRRKAGPTAAPHGLSLMAVGYAQDAVPAI